MDAGASLMRIRFRILLPSEYSSRYTRICHQFPTTSGSGSWYRLLAIASSSPLGDGRSKFALPTSVPRSSEGCVVGSWSGRRIAVEGGQRMGITLFGAIPLIEMEGLRQAAVVELRFTASTTSVLAPARRDRNFLRNPRSANCNLSNASRS
jgi:hypothetical protein